MVTANSAEHAPTFSSEAIRLLIGCITFTLPVLAWGGAAFAPLTSISASYYTTARDVFVGLLFVLGAFLFVYKGRALIEDWIANLGALAAVMAAIFPTSCDLCPTNSFAAIHLLAGAGLFIVAAYFCLGPFRHAAQGKDWVEAKRRVRFYVFCGSAILACLALLGVVELAMTAELKKAWAPIFWGEAFMLWTFGGAWIVAAKVLPWFSSEREQLKFPEELRLGALNLAQYWKR
jgi:hypothetical protein